MKLALAMLLLAAAVQSDRPAALESAFSASDLDLDPDPARAEWARLTPVMMEMDYLGERMPGPPTEVRSRWTTTHLYLLYACPFDVLNLKPDPDTSSETPRLWNWDVAEAFIGWDLNRMTSYRELQVSPQGEWVDLEIDRANPQAQAGMRWNSGVVVRARIDQRAKIWFGLMRIPWSAIDPRPPVAGRTLRIGLFRIAGVEPTKRYYAWRPTGERNFHVPEAFGQLVLN